ncbi:MAG: FadR family transcriptional regulator [Syntrophaceae bacterium]|nr:FadR family transcriptional regulator [Syntrophaceae bacterium]
MGLKPVEKILVSDGILDQIRTAILSGELAPGQKLPPEIEMASQLSASRSSLREALNALVHMGYLERRNRGLYVTPDSFWKSTSSLPFARSQQEWNIAEIIEVRQIIETELSASAAKRAEPEDMRALEESLRQMESQIGDAAGFIEADYRFHLSIARAAKNSILYDFIQKIRDLLKENIALVIQESNISRRSLHYHQRIFEAIKEGDASRARRLMAGHLSDIGKEFLKVLYRSSPPVKGKRTGEISRRLQA